MIKQFLSQTFKLSDNKKKSKKTSNYIVIKNKLLHLHRLIPQQMINYSTYTNLMNLLINKLGG